MHNKLLYIYVLTVKVLEQSHNVISKTFKNILMFGPQFKCKNEILIFFHICIFLRLRLFLQSSTKLETKQIY